MKKLLILPLLVFALTSCEKENQQHCWSCSVPKTTKDQFDNNTTVIEKTELCDMTEYEIDRHKDRYSARKMLTITYGTMTCEQLPDKE